jgi:tetratricopeptide (TPR) repeat protein
MHGCVAVKRLGQGAGLALGLAPGILSLALVSLAQAQGSPGDAPYRAGLRESEAGRHARAAAFWAQAVRLDPAHVNAHYNLAQHHQLRGDPRLQLQHFLAAGRLQPSDAEIAKKVLQSYHRTGDVARAAAARQRLLALIRSGRDPATRSWREFCFDQFLSGADRVLAYETLNPTGDLVYHFRFRVEHAGKVVRSINVESSAVARELGTPYLLGESSGGRHRTFPIGWKVLPPYPELKATVLRVLAGQVAAGASSSPAPR